MKLFNPLLIASFALAAVPLHLAATDGRIPISSAPYTISAPGSYYLTNNLTLSTGTVINITASDVTLNLSGLSITNTGTTNGSFGIAISAGYPDRVRVTNGRVIGGYYGVYAYNASGAVRSVQIDHMLVTGQSDTGIRISGQSSPLSQFQAIVQDNILSPTSATCAIALTRLYGTNSRVERNTVNGCRGAAFGWGIYLGLVSDATVADNQVYNSLSYGIYFLGGSNYNEISHNRLSGNGTGLQISGTSNHFAQNWAVNNTTNYGIVAGNRSSGDNCDPTACTN